MGKIITGVSLDEAIAKKAKAIAKQGRRTFSNYVEGLLINDQKRRINEQIDKKEHERLKRRKK